MAVRELSIRDSFEYTPTVHGDDRGHFVEWFQSSTLERTLGYRPNFVQGNISLSKSGVLRGIHYAEVPSGQAKYVTAVSGAAIDYVVDLRVGSPTFGAWDSVRLDATERRAVYLAEGLGHAFLALEDSTTISYLVTDVYRREREHAVHPLDASIGLAFPLAEDELILSDKDAQAPTLEEALAGNTLATLESCNAWYAQARQRPVL